MITSRQCVIRTLTHQPVERAPRDLQTLLGGEKCRADELVEILARYPLDIERADFKYPRGQRAQGRPYETGRYTDPWGCVWEVAEPGTAGEVCGPPLAQLADASNYVPPRELLENHKMARVNEACAQSNRFVLASSDVRPWDRLQFLCGSAQARAQLAHGTRAIRGLLAMLHEFYCQELQMWADSDVDGVLFRDDWTTDNQPSLSANIFRGLFKPLYRDYCTLLHGKDKFVFFHTNGPLGETLGDLIEVGVDAVNCPLCAADLERLAGEFRGRITFGCQLDRQLLCSGKPGEVRAAVRRIRKALDFGCGGLIAQCPWGPKIPFSNITALCEAWARPLPMHEEIRD